LSPERKTAKHHPQSADSLQNSTAKTIRNRRRHPLTLEITGIRIPNTGQTECLMLTEGETLLTVQGGFGIIIYTDEEEVCFLATENGKYQIICDSKWPWQMPIE